MSSTNVRQRNVRVTFEGGPALPTSSPIRELRRAVASCLLWEDNFYESGEEIGARIRKLAAQCDPTDVVKLAVEARTEMNLRHAPLWLITGLFGRKDPVVGLSDGVAAVIRRADEPGEILAMYRKATKSKAFPAALKRGIAKAFVKFDAYQLGKYNRKVEFGLKDVLRITHPKPQDEAQAALWKSVIDGTLASPDTWEVELSTGKDKKATFERLIGDGKLGYLALLRNLRNMVDSDVNPALVRNAIEARKGAHNVLPFRYVAAARHAPRYEPSLDKALIASIENMPHFLGETIVLVDVSGSMNEKLSGKSELTRADAAATLASIIPGHVRVFTFDTSVRELAPRKGMAGVAEIKRRVGGGTYLGAAVEHVNQFPHDRLIVITDEQSADTVREPRAKHAYMINVAGYRHEVGYGKWTRISGFSENVLRFVRENEVGLED